jgi:glycine/D-amino acid oxidase-like deaminating enzyme
MELPRTAGVVVIGGGVIGASIAFHLARMGAGQVVLLERKHLAAGSTGTSSGLVRMHYDNPVLAENTHPLRDQAVSPNNPIAGSFRQRIRDMLYPFESRCTAAEAEKGSVREQLAAPFANRLASWSLHQGASTHLFH